MTIKDLKNLMLSKCTNLFRAASVVKGQMQPIRYEREDLNKLAEKAYSNGEQVFYAVLVNPDDPNSLYVESTPIYEYNLARSLTEEEYNSLFGDV